MKYYFIVDTATQWFSFVTKVTDEQASQPHEVLEKIEVPPSIHGEFLNNIFSRELQFTRRLIRDDYYYGWSLSEKEFLNIKRLTELLPLVNEYEARLQ